MKEKEQWAANIQVNNEYFYLGCFDYEIEAAMAYNEAKIEFYGWKAKLNQISQEEIDDLWNSEFLVQEV